MRVKDLITERVDPGAEIQNMSVILPGSLDEYFVRFTDQDKLGFSQKQHFGRTPDVGDDDYDPHALPNRQGRPALWFYPLKYYLRQKDLYATNMPYVWLVRIKPNAWLQPVAGQTVKKDAPQGKQRVGMLTKDQGIPMAIFFRPAFDVVDRWSTAGGKR